MDPIEKTRELLVRHYQQYPKLQIQDVFKYLHQSAFGCEHMISSKEKAIDYIRKEGETVSAASKSLIEPLDGAYSRVHLAYLNHGLRAEELGELFFLSAQKEPNGQEALEKKLLAAKTLVHERTLPFSEEDFEKNAAEWKSLGYPAVHHSEIFRIHYHPSYRVIANRYLPLLPSLEN